VERANKAPCKQTTNKTAQLSGQDSGLSRHAHVTHTWSWRHSERTILIKEFWSKEHGPIVTEGGLGNSFLRVAYLQANYCILHTELVEFPERRVKCGNSCYHRTFYLIVYCLKKQILKYETVILPVVPYGCQTWSLALWRNTDWGCLRTRYWGEYFDRGGTKWRESGENCITKSFVICTLRQA
jgi:hypothetical protein